jgi:Prokaryotic dksA/traR C4-type zinc finger
MEQVEQVPDVVVPTDVVADAAVEAGAAFDGVADTDVADAADAEPEVEMEIEVVVVESAELDGPGGLDGLDGTGAEIGIGYDALVASVEQVLDDVDGALARLQDGTYGRCDVCGDGIADERLAAEPTARACERHLPLAHAS